MLLHPPALLTRMPQLGQARVLVASAASVARFSAPAAREASYAAQASEGPVGCALACRKQNSRLQALQTSAGEATLPPPWSSPQKGQARRLGSAAWFFQAGRERATKVFGYNRARHGTRMHLGTKPSEPVEVGRLEEALDYFVGHGRFTDAAEVPDPLYFRLDGDGPVCGIVTYGQIVVVLARKIHAALVDPARDPHTKARCIKHVAAGQCKSTVARRRPTFETKLAEIRIGGL